MNKLSKIFWIIAILLSNAMCATIAYNYSELKWGGEYAGYSAPASTAFIYAIPFEIAIIICIILAIKSKKLKNFIYNKRYGKKS